MSRSVTKRVGELNTVLRDIRDKEAQKEDGPEPAGWAESPSSITASNIVRVSVNKRQGVRPLLRFTIFDKNAAGITSDKPKALIELLKVNDVDSEARIVKTYDQGDPIRYNDYIFSVGWSYDHPQRFDLIGKIDINRDGKDDRGDLIRMIEASGGVVEYDLPPPNTDRTPGLARPSPAATPGSTSPSRPRSAGPPARSPACPTPTSPTAGRRRCSTRRRRRPTPPRTTPSLPRLSSPPRPRRPGTTPSAPCRSRSSSTCSATTTRCRSRAVARRSTAPPIKQLLKPPGPAPPASRRPPADRRYPAGRRHAEVIGGSLSRPLR